MAARIPLILFTGLPGAGVSTRTMALRLALGHNNRFKAYEANQEGDQITGMERKNEIEFLEQMMRQTVPAGVSANSAPRQSVAYLRLEARGQTHSAEIWERSYHDAVRVLNDVQFACVVISVPIQIEHDSKIQAQLDSLIRPLRRRHWVEYRPDNVPWIVLELTQYETLFWQLTPEMLTEVEPAQFASSFATPYSFAARKDIREVAVRSFLRRWIGDNELTQLANAERQWCSLLYPAGPRQGSRVMVQVATAWGFLSGPIGLTVRQPANFRLSGDTGHGFPSPRFPNRADIERRTRHAPGASVDTTLTWVRPNDSKALEQAAERFFQAWRPIGIVDPVATAVWQKASPNMFWLPEMASSH